MQHLFELLRRPVVQAMHVGFHHRQLPCGETVCCWHQRRNEFDDLMLVYLRSRMFLSVARFYDAERRLYGYALVDVVACDLATKH